MNEFKAPTWAERGTQSIASKMVWCQDLAQKL